jgi:hypothetical protein
LPQKYEQINNTQFKLCEDLYSYEKYCLNIKKFYIKDYTFA